MGNHLKRGVDPYADAAVTDRRTGQVPFSYNGTEYAAGGYKYLPNDFKGRIRELVVVMQETAASADHVLQVIMGTETLGTLTIAQNAAAGSKHRIAIADDADDFNQVDEGDIITILSDGGGTGSLVGFVRVSADT